MNYLIADKPKFSDSNHTSTIYKVEGEFFTITFEADGNPSDISYEWKKDDKLNNQHGSTLAIGKLSRNDAGFYTCQATNSEGSSDLISFRLAVKCKCDGIPIVYVSCCGLFKMYIFSDGPSIVNISNNVIASNGSDAELFCTVSGNPIEAYHVTWVAPHVIGLDQRSQALFENNTSTLKLTSVTNRDAGLFFCVVNNTVGSAVNKSSRLIIERKKFYFGTIMLMDFEIF